jgi:hypothetical protein
LVVVGFLAIPAQANQGSFQSCLDIAKHQVNQEVDLQKDCPELFDEFQKQGLIMAVELTSTGKVSVWQLGLLAEFTHPAGRLGQLDQNGLGQLIAGIMTTESTDPEREWWQAILKWLDGLKTGDYESEYQWLVRFLSKIKPSEQAIRLFFYGSIALLVLISLGLVINESYRAGIFDKLLGNKRLPKPAQTGRMVNANSMMSKQQLATLLEQVLNRLIDTQMIPCDPSLTYRQLMPYLNQQTGGLDGIFVRLVNEAEPILYGNRPANAQMFHRYQGEIQKLLGKSKT